MSIHVHDTQNLDEGNDGEASGTECVEQGQPILARACHKQQADKVTAKLRFKNMPKIDAKFHIRSSATL